MLLASDSSPLVKVPFIMYMDGHFMSKNYGLGLVGFPKQTPRRCHLGGFPLSLFQRCCQTLD
jgi:hypothetical protein